MLSYNPSLPARWIRSCSPIILRCSHGLVYCCLSDYGERERERVRERYIYRYIERLREIERD